jgi:aryl-alcohol dehydrogenase-like predicted oxidoreductase
VPDYDELASLTKAKVEAIIDRSLERLQQERLDMVQFHWWNYEVPGWVEAAQWLRELQQAGKIELLSLTNFNSEKTAEIASAGVPLTTTQVQYSLLDPRPEKALTGVCTDHGMQMLCYGSLAGGFLSERWLGRSDADSQENRSLIKYRLDDRGNRRLGSFSNPAEHAQTHCRPSPGQYRHRGLALGTGSAPGCCGDHRLAQRRSC